MNKNAIIGRIEALERTAPAPLQVLIYNDAGAEKITTAREYITEYLPRGWRWRKVAGGNSAGEVSALIDALVMTSYENKEAGREAVTRFNTVFTGIKPPKTTEKTEV